MRDRHQQLNLLKHHFYRIDLPFHVHGGAERPPEGTMFPGLWIDTQGLHFFQYDERVSAGRVAHEAAHLALMPPGDRKRVKLGCLAAQNILTCGHDQAAEVWAAAAFAAAGLDVLDAFTDTEDYCQFDTDPYVLALEVVTLIERGEHAGVEFLKSLGMMTEFPHMNFWMARNRQVKLHKIQCCVDLDEDLLNPSYPVGCVPKGLME